MEASPNEMQRRARAIWGYSGQEQEPLAAAAKIKPARLKAWTSRTRPANPTMPELVRLAAAAGVPRTFAERGFEGLGQDELAARLKDIEDLLSAVALDSEARDLEVLRRLAAMTPPAKGNSPPRPPR